MEVKIEEVQGNLNDCIQMIWFCEVVNRRIKIYAKLNTFSTSEDESIRYIGIAYECAVTLCELRWDFLPSRTFQNESLNLQEN